jgi:hypothetical protein
MNASDLLLVVMPDLIRHPWVAGQARNDKGE